MAKSDYSSFKCKSRRLYRTGSYRVAQSIALKSQKYTCARSFWNDSGYLFIPGPCPVPIPPAGAPLLGLWSCPPPAGAEMEAGAPAVGTAPPGCPGWPSPSRLASFPIVPLSETEDKDEICWLASDRGVFQTTGRKLSAAPLPPSSPTIQHPERSAHACAQRKGSTEHAQSRERAREQRQGGGAAWTRLCPRSTALEKCLDYWCLEIMKKSYLFMSFYLFFSGDPNVWILSVIRISVSALN